MPFREVLTEVLILLAGLLLGPGGPNQWVHGTAFVNATNPELVKHLGIPEASIVVITIPDHRATVTVIRLVRSLGSGTPIIARSRYHAFADDIQRAGATVAVDEEDWTGRRLGLEVNRMLRIAGASEQPHA